MRLQCYCDASFNVHEGAKSHAGIYITIENQLLSAPSNENIGRHVKFKDICPSYFEKF